MSNIYPIEIDQGATFVLSLDIENEVDGCKFDITDYEYAGQIRDTYGAVTASAVFTMVATSPTEGELQAQLPASRTNNLVPGTKYYDIEITSGSVVLRIIEGEAKITPQATK